MRTRSSPPPQTEFVAQAPPRRMWRVAVRAFTRNKLAVAGLLLLLVLTLFSFAGPLIYQTDQIHSDIMAVRLPPQAGHPLGTNEIGYDQLGRLMEGGRTSIEIGVAAGLLATIFGTLWGAVAGYFGGLVDSVMMRVVDSLLAIPVLLLRMVVATIVRPNTVMILVLALVSWLVPARLARAETLTLRTRLYVQAVKMMGGGGLRAIGRHVIPNAIGTVVVCGTFLIADAVLGVAYLSFLGLGIPPPATSWGAMLSDGVNSIYNGHWWLLYPPGIAIVLLVIAFNLIGDGLRDAFEVRIRR